MNILESGIVRNVETKMQIPHILQNIESKNNISADSIGKYNDKKLYNACMDFEALFVKQMLDSMKKTVDKTGLLDGGMAEEIFDDMLYDKYAQKISKTADFGIAEIMYRQLSKKET